MPPDIPLPPNIPLPHAGMIFKAVFLQCHHSLNSFLSNPKTVKIDHFFLFFFYSTSISNYVESYTSFERVGNNLSKKNFFSPKKPIIF